MRTITRHKSRARHLLTTAAAVLFIGSFLAGCGGGKSEEAEAARSGIDDRNYTTSTSVVHVGQVTPGSVADRQPHLYPAKIDGSWGYIDKTGEIVLEPRFDHARPFSEGLAAVEVDGEWGYIDGSGETVIEPRFEDAHEFSEGFAIVEEDGSEAYIDRTGRVTITAGPDWTFAYPFSEGRALISTGPRWGYIDTSGDMAIEPRFDLAGPFSSAGLASVSFLREDRRGAAYIDRTGQTVIEPDFIRARHSGSFSEGLAPVRTKDEDLYGYIDTQGEFVIEPNFRSAREFSEGMAAVFVGEQVGRGWGYIDQSGELIIGPDPKVEQARSFSEGRAAVQVKSRWGYLNPSGEMVIEPRFVHVEDFTGPLALVGEGDRVGYIDRQGRWVRSWDAG